MKIIKFPNLKKDKNAEVISEMVETRYNIYCAIKEYDTDRVLSEVVFNDGTYNVLMVEPVRDEEYECTEYVDLVLIQKKYRGKVARVVHRKVILANIDTFEADESIMTHGVSTRIKRYLHMYEWTYIR